MGQCCGDGQATDQADVLLYERLLQKCLHAFHLPEKVGKGNGRQRNYAERSGA